MYLPDTVGKGAAAVAMPTNTTNTTGEWSYAWNACDQYVAVRGSGEGSDEGEGAGEGAEHVDEVLDPNPNDTWRQPIDVDLFEQTFYKFRELRLENGEASSRLLTREAHDKLVAKCR